MREMPGVWTLIFYRMMRDAVNEIDRWEGLSTEMKKKTPKPKGYWVDRVLAYRKADKERGEPTHHMEKEFESFAEERRRSGAA